LILAIALTALAADPDVVVVVPVVEPGRGTASIVTVDPSTLPAGADLATAVGRVPGVSIRRLGGPGDLSVVSIRGAAPRQTLVRIDGVPLNPDGGSTIDLGEIPLAGVAAVDVVRGGAGGVSSGAPAGAVDLRLGSERPPSLSASYGSFGTARLTASGGGVVVDALRSNGAFSWSDDGGTRYDAGDDVVRRRANNDVAQLAGHAALRVGRARVVLSGLGREEGIPGPIGAGTEHVRFGIARGVAGVGWRRAGRSALAWVSAREERLTDAIGEIGLTRERTRDRSGSVGLEGRLLVGPERAGLGLGGALRADAFAPRDLDAGPGDLRTRAVARAHATWHTDTDAADVDATVEIVGVADHERLGWVSPRVALAAPVGAARARASFGHGVRPPDWIELYGDRGGVVGRPDLRPERQWSAEVAIGGDAALTWEVAAWARRARDGIVYVQNGQKVSMPINVAESAAGGAEASVRWDAGPVALSGAASAIRTMNLVSEPAYRGRRLPGVPSYTVDVGVEGAHGPARGSMWIRHVGRSWLDAANQGVVPPRTLVDAAIAADLHCGLVGEVSLTNLLDARVARVPRNPGDPGDDVRIDVPVQDLAGYPLPGRAVSVTLTWSPSW
jgi:vitamin B12 transporter